MSEELPEGTHPSRPISLLQLKHEVSCAHRVCLKLFEASSMAACAKVKKTAVVN
jgi:hypothetical protein